MEPQKKEDFSAINDDKKISILAHLELFVNRGKFDGIYLLSEDATIAYKEEAPNLSVDLESLRLTLIHAIKVYPQFFELILNYQDHMVVVRPVKSIAFKGGSANIPGISYIALVLPPNENIS